VHRWPYEYANPDFPKDHVMQTEPLTAAERKVMAGEGPSRHEH
jgi:hypothetical protein